MIKSLCETCKNQIRWKIYFTAESRLLGEKCIYGVEREKGEITNCSHFEKKSTHPSMNPESEKKIEKGINDGDEPRKFKNGRKPSDK